MRERERYLLKVSDASNSGANITSITLKATFNTDLLLPLITLDEFPRVSKIEDGSEEQIEAWLAAKDDVLLHQLSLEDLEAAVISNARINLNEPDATLRIMGLFSDYTTLLRSKNWEELITSNPKVATKHICMLLKPPALRNRIETDLELGMRELKRQWVPFYKYLLAKTVACNEFVFATTTSSRLFKHQQISPWLVSGLQIISKKGIP